MSRHGQAHIVRWIARIWSLLSLAFLLVVFVGHVRESPPGPWLPAAEYVAMAFFPVGVLVGLGLAWWREGLGGIVGLLSLTGFYLWMWVLRGRLPGGPWFALVAAPAALFLVAAFLDRTDRSLPQ